MLDLLAFHFGRSNNQERRKKYFLLAGDASRKAYANSAAATYYKGILPQFSGSSIALNLKFSAAENLGLS